MSKKILVIRFSSIGDIVLTTPVIRALHQQLDAEVHFLTKKTFAPIVEYNPHVTKIFALSAEMGTLVEALNKERYDHIVDLHHNLRSKRIKMVLGRPSSSFYKLNFEKWLLVRFGINRLPDVHIVDRYFAAASSLSIQKDEQGLDFFIPADKHIPISDTFGFKPGSYVSIVIGATYPTKCLTADQIILLCQMLDTPVVLMGGKAEMAKAQLIIDSLPSGKVKNACGAFDILQSASILGQAGSIIAHDTGLMHIAAALNKPQVVIWGNTIPQFGMYPYYGGADIKWISFEQKELKCRPCTKLGFDRCPKGHFKCILDHDLTKITKAALSLFPAHGQ